jgi:hydroxymethylpyrimidine kinase/phosphomethylpyrimidine kinase
MNTSQSRADALLTIAGHDSTNGAGITKDLEVFSFFDFFGLSAPTALVIQGPLGARSIHPVASEVLSDMLEEAEKAFHVNGIKIGVIPDVPQINVIIRFLERHKDAFIVLDPVFTAKNGLPLITESGVQALKYGVFPFASCITPNLDETELLLGHKISTVEHMKQAAIDLSEMGPEAVIVKGGHLQGDPVDVLFDGSDMSIFEKKRVHKTIHGTGCLFSSTLLSFCALGYSMREALIAAEAQMEAYINESFQPHSEGYSYVSPGIGSFKKGPVSRVEYGAQ